MTNYEMVREFHAAFDHPMSVPFANDELLTLRRRLIEEELKELTMEMFNGAFEVSVEGEISTDTKAKLSKELADLLYVLYGFAVVYGIPIDDVFLRVHSSNMSKLGADGKPILREDGKVLKSSNYKEPILDDLFKETVV